MFPHKSSSKTKTPSRLVNSLFESNYWSQHNLYIWYTWSAKFVVYLLRFSVLTTVALLVFIMMQSCWKPSALLRIWFSQKRHLSKYCKLCLFKEDLGDEQHWMTINQSILKTKAKQKIIQGLRFYSIHDLPKQICIYSYILPETVLSPMKHKILKWIKKYK